MYALVVHRRAARYLGTLSQDQQGRIKHVLNEMKHDPLAISGIKRMAGDWAGYRRVRVGDIRVIFWIDKDKHLVSIL